MKSENKTGIASKPDMAKAMLDAVDEFPPTSTGSMYGPEAVGIEYARSVDEDQRGYGSVPGPEPTLLLDKLGERLAFERTGVRLYETVIAKLEALGSFAGGPSRVELLELLNEEHCHASLLHDAIVSNGGDPSAVTPSADLAGVLAGGVVKVLGDPRTTLLQGLEAMLVAELADGAGWDALIGIAREAGLAKLVASFELAAQTEAEHRAKIQAWVAAGQGR